MNNLSYEGLAESDIEKDPEIVKLKNELKSVNVENKKMLNV